METKRLITMMLLFFAVMFGWRMYVDYLYTRHPEWRRPGETATTQPAFSTSAPAEIPGSATTAATTTGPATNSATSTSTQASTKSTMDTAALRVIPTTGSASPTAVTLGSLTDSRMVVKLSPVGAGVQSVTLPDYKAPDAKGIYTFQTPYDDADANSRAFSTRSVTVNGAKLDLVGQAWSLESSDAHSATFVIDCGLVRVRKVYQLTDKNSDGKGYELIIRHTVENKTAQPIKASIAFAGPTTPPRETERGPDLQILGGYDSGYEKIIVDHHMVEEFSVKSPTRDMTHGTDKAPLLWAGAASVYFDAIVRPEPLEANGNSPKYISNLDVAALNPESEPIDRHVVMTFTTTEMAIPAKGSISIPTTNFLGPRWRQVLNEPHYSAFPLGYDSTLVLTSGPCAYCTFEFLIKGLVKLLAFFHFIFRDWGLAIICLVLLVRGILHPITKRSQVSMMRMGKMGPEMERLKKKYADDKDELNKQTMALYKDQGVGAYLGCLPMFLQMPIWIALWSALQSTFELRQSPFLYFFGHHLTWIHDLAKPDHLVTWTPYILPSQIWVIGGAHISGFNLLPILLAVVFFLQQKYTPKPPAATPEAETQQKMMLWMSVLLFPVMLYSGPAGLNLYILTSTTIGIFESKRIREHIKQKEEEEKAGRIIVDAPKSMKKKRGDDDSNSGVKRLGAPDKPKGGIGGWIAQMQAKAEELRRAADKDRKQNCANWDEMRSDDTIAAISSAVGPAARMIVRMSGPEAHSIAAQLCSNRSTAGSAQLTTLELNKMRIPAWVYAFASPRSYTAQDLIEFHIPGNPLLAKMLLSDLLTRGARHAEAGEFTARAYFAGRIDLAEAEGVAATISAHGEAELRAARQLLSGELSRRLAPAMELLADTLALVEVGIDFSDEDVTFLSSPQVRERVARIDKLLVDLVDNSAGFERLSHEPTFVLAGRPNAGKSTLLNALAGHERAVVSDVAGTTRDILFAEAHLQRGLVRIYDVAGLGDGVAGEIDHQMTHQATLALETADFVLLVRDISDTRPQLELPRPPDLIVQSKADLAGAPPSQTEAIRVSVLNGEGMDTLREQLDRLAFGSPAGPSTLALNARHLEAIGQARVSLSRALTGIDAGFEVLAMDLRDALDALGRVLGQITPDDLLGRVFSAFCIGK